MDLSIIIVSYNTREILRECLASVHAGSGSLDVEVFVVDNASADGSADMVARDFPGVHLIRNPDNRGFAAANNQALVQASGRHLLLLNADTVVLGDVLTEASRYLDMHRRVGVFGCRVLNTDRTMQPTCFGYPSLVCLGLLATGLQRLPWLGWHRMHGWARDTERDVEVVSGCALWVRREVAEQVGLLDEQFFFYAEETDWCRRIAEAGWTVRFAPVGEIVHYGGASSVQLNDRRGLMLAEALVRLHRKHGGLVGGVLAWALVTLNIIVRAIVLLPAGLLGRHGSRGRRWRESIRALCRVWSAWPRGVVPRIPVMPTSPISAIETDTRRAA